MNRQKRCRHSGSWIMAHGWLEWCYVCGAIRHLQPVSGENASVPVSTWARPTGDRNDNPYDRMRERI